MRISLILLIICSLAKESKAQRIITLKPNGEVKQFTSGEIRRHVDMDTEGNRMFFSDSGKLICELYLLRGRKNGYYKLYDNGILVELKLYKDNVPVGIHYFWDEKGVLKKSITYKDGKEIATKEY
jgi:antitoxin component YwqK of YwqJK toxin-antitoxin module